MRKLLRHIITVSILVVVTLIGKPSFAATDYSHAFNVDTNLCYSITNYYAMNYAKQCYAGSWRSLFVQDGFFDRDNFEAQKASFERASTNGKGAWAVINENQDFGNTTSDPYFITLYWIEDNSDGHAKITFANDGSGVVLDQGSDEFNYAVIAPSSIIQGGPSQEPTYLWGGTVGNSIGMNGSSYQSIFYSTFPVEYPSDYNGPAVPGSPTEIPKKKAPTYLALGDSFSSGEGDLEKKADGSSYYLPGTEVNGFCHVSSRSYPFLLRDYWGISNEDMHSVACSGAWVTKDYLSSPDTYSGQHDELGLLPSESREKTIQAALDNYSPGIVPQIELVKKYKPEVITLTGGGNDVGFADIIKYCAADIPESIVFDYSCEYVEGGVLNGVLNDTLDSQYKATRNLVRAIKEASPDSKIYYIGYPSFVAGSDGDCALNVGTLNGKERDMVNKAVTRLNGVLKQVAADEHVQYVDIEDVLDGGRLCEGSEYVSGVWDVGLLSGDFTEAFHPNAKGHSLMANAINKTVSDPISSYTPEPAHTKVIEPVTYTERQVVLGDDTVFQGQVLRAELRPSTFAGSSDIVVVGYSEPTPLGTYRTNSDGSLQVSIQLPTSMMPGFHLLTLTGTSTAGEPLRLFQYFTVTAPPAESTSLGSQQSPLKKDETPLLAEETGSSLPVQPQPEALAFSDTRSALKVKGDADDSLARTVSDKNWLFIGGATLGAGILLYVIILKTYETIKKNHK